MPLFSVRSKRVEDREQKYDEIEGIISILTSCPQTPCSAKSHIPIMQGH